MLLWKDWRGRFAPISCLDRECVFQWALSPGQMEKVLDEETYGHADTSNFGSVQKG